MHHQKGAIKSFLLKRALRIIPAYYVVLFICTFFVYVEILPVHSQVNLGVSFFYHLIFMQDYFSANINVAFWSLGVEEKFYILVLFILPTFYVWYQKYNTKSLFLIMFVILGIGLIMRGLSYYLGGQPSEYTEYFTIVRSPFHSCLDPLFLGVIISLVHSKYEKQLDCWAYEKASVIFLISFLFFCGLLVSHPFDQDLTIYDVFLQPILVAICSGGMVFGAIFGGGFKLLEHRFCYYIAVLSYSLYLVHLPFVYFSYYIAGFILTSHVSMVLFFFTFIVVFFSTSFLASVLLYGLIEKPFLRMKSKLVS